MDALKKFQSKTLDIGGLTHLRLGWVHLYVYV